MTAQALDLANYALTLYAVPPLVVGTLIATLGMVALIRERGTRVSATFCLVTTSAAIWLLTFSAIYSTPQETLARWWADVEHAGVVFIPSMAYVFTLAIVDRYREFRAWAWASIAVSGVFYLVVLFTDWFITGMHQYSWGYYPRYGPLSLLFLVFFFSTMIASLRLFWVESRRCAPGTRKGGLQGLLLAFSVGYVGSVDFLPAYGVPVYPFGYLPVLGFVALGARAIWRYRLVDITPAFAAEQIIRTLPDALFVLDHDGHVRIVNQATCRLLGRAESELIGVPVNGISGAIFKPELLDTLLQSDAARQYEVTIRTKQGGVRWLSVTASAMRDRDNRTLAIVCIARDVTEHRRADSALRASEERFRSVAQSANDAIISADSSGVILTWNKGAQTIFGYAEDEVVGKPLTLLMPERYRAAHCMGLERVHATGESRMIGTTVELHGLRKDGIEFPLELSLATWKSGGEIFYSSIIRDITERKRAEEALGQIEEQLRQAQRMEAMGKIAGEVARDFDKLITVITRQSMFLMGSFGKDDRLRGKIEEIKNAADQAAARTHHLLAFSSSQVLSPKVLDLNSSVNSLRGMLQWLGGKEIALVTTLDQTLGWIKADPGQIELIIMALARNAKDAMPQGGTLTIETANVKTDVAVAHAHGAVLPGRYAMLAVCDTGFGMDAEAQIHLFEPFFTAKGWNKESGMGLATVYGIVKQSGGTVVVSSELGRGTTFKVYLPLVESDSPLAVVPTL